MESKKLLPNASYFAFTATPKNKTLEIFGTPVRQKAGTPGIVPFHVLHDEAGDPGRLHHRRAGALHAGGQLLPAWSRQWRDDPEFDTKRAGKKLRRYVEDNDHAIRMKAEIMVDHFHEQVAGLQKIGGQARAMVVTSSIQRAISYFYAIRDYLAERRSPYRAIAAFSGEHEYSGVRRSQRHPSMDSRLT